MKDVLIGLGVAIATVVIPALIGVLTTVAPIILTFAAVVVGVSLLRKAWENNFGGIQEKTKAVWNFLKGIFDILRPYLEIYLSNAVTSFKTAWDQNNIH